ncbi:glycosyltransferase [Paenibacillus vini]|uniref:Uncharacterized protein n=1 Tax=Paenibacillus vini TaxID=1476024 RepID=A0ABQ4MHD7_9BACL|nr:hypothetical protein [Paenibacillus vini]GIP55062.1 hypothetical protein J42TS3_40970 [Paenibacillus vini]
MQTYKPRLLWVCPHIVLRYEEIPLFVDAGAEVIPSLGEGPWLPYDPHYDNELDDMYPQWRAYCTIPTNVVEKIRRISLESPTDEEAALINQWIDIISIATFPKLAEKVLDWFQGTVIFRSFGIPQLTNYTNYSLEEGVDLNKFANANNYVWSPILKALDEIEDPRLIKNTLYMNYFVSKERLPFEWARKNSVRKISTLISYIDKSKWVDNIFLPFERAFRDFDFIVLGRNDKSSPRCQHPSIVGNVDFKKSMSILCNSRIFCYGGALTHYHMHFTPLEAMTMNVPIFFTETCGLAREASENGLTKNQLRELGMCDDYNEMAGKVKQIIDDFDYLDHLRGIQHEVLLPAFSRERALKSTKQFIESLSEKVARHRIKNPYDHVYTIAASSTPMVRRNITQSKDMPAEPGEYRVINSKKAHGITGEVVQDKSSNYFLRQAIPGVHAPGLLVNETIVHMPVGEYEITLTLYAKEASAQEIGLLDFSAWNPDHQYLMLLPLVLQETGLITIKGKVSIDKSFAKATKQLNIYWPGTSSIHFESFRIEKISNHLPESSVTTNWSGGFSTLETFNDENWRWCSESGELELTNHSSRPKTVLINTGIKTGYPENASLFVSSDVWSEQFIINCFSEAIARSFTIPPGTHTIKFTCDAQRVDVPPDGRVLVFRLNNFSLRELN